MLSSGRPQWNRTFIALSLAGLGVATSVAAASADGLPTKTPGFAAAPSLSQILDSTTHMGASHAGVLDSPLLGLKTDPQSSLLLPLNLQTGADTGFSFLYYSPAVLVASPDGKQTLLNRQRATYGFSNSLALGSGNAAHLKGLFYLSGGAMPQEGPQKQSQAISQALDYAHGAWKINAHYQSVGTDFDGFNTLRGASPALGMLSGMTTDTLAALEKARGKSDLGFAADYTTGREHLGVSFGQVADELAKLNTQQQSLSFWKAFGGGLRFDADRNVLSTHPLDGGSGQSVTTTTNHWRLGYDAGKGTSFSADLSTVGDNKGRSERTLGLNFDRHIKNMTLQASYLGFTPTTGPAQATQHLQLAWQATPTLALDGFLTERSNPGGQQGDDHQQQVHLNWQMRKDLTFEGRWTQETNSRWAQAGDERQLMLRGLIARNLNVDASMTSKTDGATKHSEEAKDLRATLTMPRFVGMRKAQWMLTVAERMSDGELLSRAGALSFDAQANQALVHFEYDDNIVTVNKERNHQTSRALRIVSQRPAGWLHYSFYYKKRGQSVGPELPDVRDYQVQLQHRQISLAYHYFNQQENPDGSVTDLVQTTFQLGGPLARGLQWSAQYNQSDTSKGNAGVHGMLVGVKGAVRPGQQLEAAYGRQEMRAGTATVHGDTYKLNYQTKSSDDDYIAFDGQLTSWDEKTPQTPDKMVATVRLDVKKTY